MQTVTPYLLYEDVEAALDFLARAFGFEEVLRYTGAAGYVNHAEMRIGDGTIYLGDPGETYRNPKQLGQETVGIYVIVDDVDVTFERACSPSPAAAAFGFAAVAALVAALSHVMDSKAG